MSCQPTSSVSRSDSAPGFRREREWDKRSTRGYRPEQCLSRLEQRATSIEDADTKFETEGVTQVHLLDPATLDHETMRLGHLAAGREHLRLHMGARPCTACVIAASLSGGNWVRTALVGLIARRES